MVWEINADEFHTLWVENKGIYIRGLSDNLIEHRNGLKAGLTEEQAAWTTWTGQQFPKNGFKTVEVIPLEDGNVSAIFKK